MSEATRSGFRLVMRASNASALGDTEDRARLEAIAEHCLRRCDEEVEALGEGLGPDGRALLALITNRNPDRVASHIAALPPSVSERLDQLSLRRRDLSPLHGRVILVHGRLDPMIPYSESLAFGQAVDGTDVHVIDGFSHINPRGVGLSGKLQLISAIQAVLKRRNPLDP